MKNDNTAKEKFIYIYDGSFEGFLSCIYIFYKERDVIKDIRTDDEQMQFFSSFKNIASNKEHFDIVYDSIQDKMSFDCLNTIYYAFLSEEDKREIKILDYIMLGFKIGAKVENMLANPSVLDVLKMAKKTSSERHKFLGLLRFKQLKNTLISFIEPTCNILPLLGNHFAKRYSNENFMIYDLKREYMLLYDKTKISFFLIAKTHIQEFIDYPDEFENFWRTYHKTMGIELRKNDKCQKNHMPVKYWKNLPEMKK